jgi:AraC-like DNA-binding protein
MRPLLLSRWECTFAEDQAAVVIPDGCRDLILRCAPRQPPEILVTALDAVPRGFRAAAGLRLVGLRFAPGVRILEARLPAVKDAVPDLLDGRSDAPGEWLFLNPDLPEVLAALRLTDRPLPRVARSLGVSLRTLQRLVTSETGHSPLFWQRLARARQAARSILAQLPLAEVAFRHGFSDQAHLCREIKRWLGVSPGRLAGSVAGELVLEPGHE